MRYSLSSSLTSEPEYLPNRIRDDDPPLLDLSLFQALDE
jgi:hypothetical protein